MLPLLVKQVDVALNLLEKLLTFDPALRISVEEALGHEYLASYHDADDEPVHPKLFDFSFESVETIDEMKKMIADEVVQFSRQSGGISDNLPRPKESLAGPQRPEERVPKEDYDAQFAAMDIDEELRMKGH